MSSHIIIGVIGEDLSALITRAGMVDRFEEGNIDLLNKLMSLRNALHMIVDPSGERPGPYTDDQLIDLINQAVSTSPGWPEAGPWTCPACRRTVSATLATCPWCLPGESAAEQTGRMEPVAPPADAPETAEDPHENAASQYWAGIDATDEQVVASE